MGRAKAYYENVNLNGVETVALIYEGERKIECFISPQFGANMVRMCVDGKNVIDFDADLLRKHGYTGTPVLYPTPNRVRDGRFTFEGRVFQYESNETPAYEHGLVHYEAWENELPCISGDTIGLKLFLDCEKGKKMYEAFPIEHRISLIYTLGKNGMQIEYEIENRDSARLPYGFALHPYFMKLAGDSGTYAKLPAQKYMQATDTLLPTGKLIDAILLEVDVISGDKLGAMDFDHVFTGLILGGKSEIWYDGVDFKMELDAGDTFSHIVFYTPAEKDFFCVENQTCSTDAHNMYAKGYVKESGLEIIEPYGKRSDFVFYRVADV